MYYIGSSVVGEYSVKEPNGNIRVVTYKADKDGFHAVVHNSKKSDHQSIGGDSGSGSSYSVQVNTVGDEGGEIGGEGQDTNNFPQIHRGRSALNLPEDQYLQEYPITIE